MAHLPLARAFTEEAYGRFTVNKPTNQPTDHASIRLVSVGHVVLSKSHDNISTSHASSCPWGCSSATPTTNSHPQSTQNSTHEMYQASLVVFHRLLPFHDQLSFVVPSSRRLSSVVRRPSSVVRRLAFVSQLFFVIVSQSASVGGGRRAEGTSGSQQSTPTEGGQRK